MYEQVSTAITTWAEEDRPREKLVIWGKASLTNAELLGIVIGTGDRRSNAIDIAKKILADSNHDLRRVSRLRSSELTNFRGIGTAKATNIIAAFELGRRLKNSESVLAPCITSSDDSFRYLARELQDLDHEEFWIILLSRSNRVICKERISIGGVSATVVDAKIIFSKALGKLASGIILAHNHPSGNLKPSIQDINLTKKLAEGAKILDMIVLDHIIITGDQYMSFADEGIM